MSRRAGLAPPVVWSIQSVAVRVRDGPQRLARVYHLLLTAPTPGAPIPPACDRKEEAHGSCDLRPGLDGAPGPATNHREPNRHPDCLGPAAGVPPRRGAPLL